MPADRSDKPSRTVVFETGMAMTLSCSPARDIAVSATPKLQAASAEASQQRGTAK